MHFHAIDNIKKSGILIQVHNLLDCVTVSFISVDFNYILSLKNQVSTKFLPAQYIYLSLMVVQLAIRKYMGEMDPLSLEFCALRQKSIFQGTQRLIVRHICTAFYFI